MVNLGTTLISPFDAITFRLCQIERMIDANTAELKDLYTGFIIGPCVLDSGCWFQTVPSPGMICLVMLQGQFRRIVKVFPNSDLQKELMRNDNEIDEGDIFVSALGTSYLFLDAHGSATLSANLGKIKIDLHDENIKFLTEKSKIIFNKDSLSIVIKDTVSLNLDENQLNLKIKDNTLNLDENQLALSIKDKSKISVKETELTYNDKHMCIEDLIDKLNNFIQIFNSHMHTSASAGSPTTAPLSTVQSLIKEDLITKAK